MDLKPITSQDYQKKIAGLKVLVVDDEPELREIIGDDFIMNKAKVLSAGSGEEAFMLFQKAIQEKAPFAIVISDIRMPQGDGVQLTSKIMALCKDQSMKAPPIILVSGFSDYSMEDVLSRGARALLNKPFQLQELRNVVANALDT